MLQAWLAWSKAELIAAASPHHLGNGSWLCGLQVADPSCRILFLYSEHCRRCSCMLFTAIFLVNISRIERVCPRAHTWITDSTLFSEVAVFLFLGCSSSSSSILSLVSCFVGFDTYWELLVHWNTDFLFSTRENHLDRCTWHPTHTCAACHVWVHDQVGISENLGTWPRPRTPCDSDSLLYSSSDLLGMGVLPQPSLQLVSDCPLHCMCGNKGCITWWHVTGYWNRLSKSGAFDSRNGEIIGQTCNMQSSSFVNLLLSQSPVQLAGLSGKLGWTLAWDLFSFGLLCHSRSCQCLISWCLYFA